MENTWPKRIARHMQNEQWAQDQMGMSHATVFLGRSLVLKCEPDSAEARNEAQMYAFLQGKLPVPQVVDAFCENGVHYLLLHRAQGVMACDPARLASPEKTVALLAQGLLLLRETPIAGCPCTQFAPDKLRRARKNLDAGDVSIADAEPAAYGKGGFKDPEALWRYLSAHQPDETPCMTHGDYCLPNVFLHGGAVSALIDLGRAGVGDRWQDIALCARSIRHNFGADYTDLLLGCLGVAPDPERMNWYLLLDELF